MHKVLVEHEPQVAVAREHRVSPGVVHQLVSRVRKHNGLLDDQVEQRTSVETQRNQIAAFVGKLNETNAIIDSAGMVR